MLHNVGAVISAVLFVVNTALHLFYPKHKNITKAFIIPSVLLVYLSLADNYSILFIVACLMSMLGDILLMGNGKKWFVSGGISFMLSHVLFCSSFLPFVDRNQKRLLFAIAFFAVYLFFCLHTSRKTGKAEGSIGPFLIFLYLMFNTAMNITSLCVLLGNPSLAGVLMYAGAILFFISDNFLFYEVFCPKGKNLFIPVIATYIFGELFIAVGYAFLK